MSESDLPGMQHLSWICLLFSAVSAVLIDPVSQQGMVHIIKMDPDLMGAAGMKIYPDQAGADKPPAYLPGCMGGFSSFRDDSHTFAVFWMPAHGQGDISGIRKQPT